MNPEKMFTVHVIKYDNTAFGAPIMFSTRDYPTIESALDMVQSVVSHPIKQGLLNRTFVKLETDQDYLSHDQSFLYVILQPIVVENQEIMELNRQIILEKEQNRLEIANMQRKHAEEQAAILGLSTEEYNKLKSSQKSGQTIKDLVNELKEKVF